MGLKVLLESVILIVEYVIDSTDKDQIMKC